MRHADDITDLFARYAAEVGRHLPAKGREDIEREIAATLADRLDDRAGGRAATLDDAVALLKETGHPRKTAASYLGGASLVGPGYYPLFLLVCRVALPVLAAVLVGALILSAALAADPAIGFFGHLGNILGSVVGGVLQAFAIIVIVFAVIERVNAHRGGSSLPDETAWDPRSLPRVQPALKIKLADQVGAIVGNTILLAAIVLLPRYAVLNLSAEGRGVVVALLSDPFLRLLPVVGAVAVAQIVAAVYLLTRRTHTGVTLAVTAMVKVLSIAAAGVYLTVFPYVLAGPGLPAGAEIGIDVLNQVIRAGCIIGIVAGSIEVAVLLVRWLRRPGQEA